MAVNEIDLTPDWERVAKFMARVLKDDGFENEHAKSQFSEAYSEILGYLQRTNYDGYIRAMRFGIDLTDGKRPIIDESELY